MKKIVLSLLLTISFTNFFIYTINAQSPLRFKEEVAQIVATNHHCSANDSVILFTGSSSIRKWTNIQDYFPQFKIINTGFGGSEMSDLLYFVDELIFNYSPYKIFIYEGDNDIASGKKPQSIIETTDSLVQKIITKYPAIQIYIISAKPSILRWNLKNNYIKLNQLYSNYCNNNAQVEFINIWDIMLDENREVKKDIFLEDELHMNSKGYELWAKEIKMVLSKL
ncbi:MAG: G-D-S-L family lipolytic protein [Chlorobi bacterium]|nr:G-D-S-L family lipolytic protein [Chlorobiota bacterium]